MANRTKRRVVLDRATNGDITVYADAGIDVFERAMHTPDDSLYMFTPKRIPDGWLGPWSEHTADAIAEFFSRRRLKSGLKH